ncbi:DUF3833 domain-containing protein [Thalassotalea sp. HSM 43]|uniref:DUF3833 domain-containing protein n=1 Tax=Thalassotalea sp. HSM 43 TaxID=2552945 RepID=UPI001080FAE5|nr:DUF3833 domain-containing protein [Thalassotalea sp. HSM 43]QBY03752.1 DUF3833 domain-containing protein [Thalassotalea sp. HSM 43]
MNTIRLLIMSSLLWLTSCSTDVSEYQDTTPVFTLETFFDGKIRGYGLVTGFNDEITRRFVVDIDASWQGDSGVLDEYFVYNDGEKQFRQWRLKKLDANNYQGEADDILGTATGQQHGAVLIWQYDMILTVDGEDYEVSFDDTMVLIDENHMINTAKIFKFGLNVANVTLFFEKLE